MKFIIDALWHVTVRCHPERPGKIMFRRFCSCVLVFWCPATRVGWAHSFTLLLWKPRDPNRQGTPIYIVSVETWIICVCVNVYYTAVLVLGVPLRSYHAVLNKWCPLCIICASVRPNSVYWRLLPSGGRPWNSSIQPSDVTCHLVAVRGTKTLYRDIWN